MDNVGNLCGMLSQYALGVLPGYVVSQWPGLTTEDRQEWIKCITVYEETVI